MRTTDEQKSCSGAQGGYRMGIGKRPQSHERSCPLTWTNEKRECHPGQVGGYGETSDARRNCTLCPWLWLRRRFNGHASWRVVHVTGCLVARGCQSVRPRLVQACKSSFSASSPYLCRRLRRRPGSLVTTASDGRLHQSEPTTPHQTITTRVFSPCTLYLFFYDLNQTLHHGCCECCAPLSCTLLMISGCLNVVRGRGLLQVF